jgi:pimeloyl-ACP methyl ester carboxylesterase
VNLKPPNALLALSDGPRALADAACLAVAAPFLRKLPKANGKQSVMVLPGFLGSDEGNGPLIRFLRDLGYTTKGWGQGRNLGVEGFDRDELERRIEALALAGNGKVSLVGHSLGGIYAREIAREGPEWVHQVITLGSPFSGGDQHTSHASRLYQRLNPQKTPQERSSSLSFFNDTATTEIYTKADGVVNWRTSCQEGSYAHVHNIEVMGSHIGLNLNAAVWYWVAKKLAQIQ